MASTEQSIRGIASDAELNALSLQAQEHQEAIFPMIRRLMVLATFVDPKDLEQFTNSTHALLNKWQHRFPTTRALQYFIRGLYTYYNTQFEETKIQLLQALDVLATEPSPEIEGIVRTLLGANFRSMGEMDLAVENLLRAQQLIDPKGEFNIYHMISFYHLGEIHATIREYHNALHYYEEAAASLKHDTIQGIAFRIYSGLAIGHLHLDQFDKSLHYSKLALATTDISVKQKSRGLLDLGIIKSKQGEYSEAIACFTESYTLRKTNGLLDASSTSLIQLAKAFIETKEYQKALDNLNEASAIIADFNAKAKKVQVVYLFARTYKLLGNYEKASEYFEQYTSLQEEEHTEQERRIFRYKNELIEQQRKELVVKNNLLKNTLDELAVVKRSRLAMLYSFVTVIVLVILSELFFDPFIETHAYNKYLSLALKIVIALLLKPIDSLYESLLYKRAFEKRKQAE